MLAGGYTLDLYCDGEGCLHGQYEMYPAKQTFFAEHGSACRRLARRQGWKFLPEGDMLCPKCRAAGTVPAAAGPTPAPRRGA